MKEIRKIQMRMAVTACACVAFGVGIIGFPVIHWGVSPILAIGLGELGGILLYGALIKTGFMPRGGTTT